MTSNPIGFERMRELRAIAREIPYSAIERRERRDYLKRKQRESMEKE